MKHFLITAILFLAMFLIVIPSRIGYADDSSKCVRIGVFNKEFEDNAVIEYLFLKQYPDYCIEYVLLNESCAVIANSALKECDVVIVNDEQLSVLSANSSLGSIYDYVNKDIWKSGLIDLEEFCFASNGVYAFPRSLTQITWLWNINIGRILNINKPENTWSWLEFINITDAFANKAEKSLMKVFPGSNHTSGLLENYMLEPLIDLVKSYPLREININMFENALNCMLDVYSANVLCSIEDTIQNDDIQLLFMPLAQGAYYRETGMELTDAEYIAPPCWDKTDPRYIAFGTYYCVPVNNSKNDNTGEFLRVVTSEESQKYFSSSSSIFSTIPPSYFISSIPNDNAEKNTVSYSDLNNYSLLNCSEAGMTPTDDSFGMFVYMRQHACRSQQYDWKELYPKLLSITAIYIDAAGSSETANALFDIFLQECEETKK